ncbi:MAG: hypothetical protein ACR2HY_05025 [Acidimicrobiales bacterium]
MIRRSLRIGARGGVVAALGFALYKIVQARRPSPALPRGSDPWAAPVAAPPAPADMPPVLATPVVERPWASPSPTAGKNVTIPGAEPAVKAEAAWVEPEGGACPTSHPVKAKLRSGIFHLPGMAAYARTSPDRCYRDEAAAAADGLRKAAR